jgi:kinesin family protein 3/17
MQVSSDRKKICLYEYQNMESLDYSHIQDYLDNQDNYLIHTYTLDQIYD